MVVVRFGDKYRQWNAADAGFAAALGKPIITLHDDGLTHALDVDGAAQAVAETPEQVVKILDYTTTGRLCCAAILRHAHGDVFCKKENKTSTVRRRTSVVLEGYAALRRNQMPPRFTRRCRRIGGERRENVVCFLSARPMPSGSIVIRMMKGAAFDIKRASARIL